MRSTSAAVVGYSASLLLLPNETDRVFLKRVITTNNRHFLRDRLCNDEPIKRIPVMKGHFPLFVQVFRLNLEHFNSIACHVLPDEPRERKRNVELPNAHLDSHLSEAGHAEIAIIVFILDEVSRMGGQPVASANKPEKCVSIQKKVHDGM